MSETLRIEQDPDGITTLTFNRPKALNALNLETMKHFAEVVAKLSSDEYLRAVILTGAGDEAFCSGGDLFELSQHSSADDARAFITVMGDALLALERLPVPVIAAINGYALGGGSEIAVACDVRIVDQNARMGFVQIKMALTPGWGAGQRLLRLVGYPKAMELLLEGRTIHAPELEALGLVNKIVERGRALENALEFARRIAQKPPDVARGIKMLLRAGLEQPYTTALQIERDLFPPLWAADAHIEAVNAFLNRTQKDDT